MKRYFWFKMKEDFFQSKEMKKLRKIAGGDTYTIIYLKLIMMSTRTEGKIIFDGLEDTFAEEIALVLDEEPENVKIAINYFIKCKLIDVMADNEIVLNEAIENIGTEGDSAERVRLHRDRKKQLALQGNTIATIGNTEKR